MNVVRDPIIALATARGRASVGIVRISGPHLVDLIHAICGQALKPRQASLLTFKDRHQEAIDEGLAIYFAAPHSFTGEDVLELQCHGSSSALDLLIDECLYLGKSQGLRLAKPGEFSERAFLNGKMDLAQAEAIADLIDAGSSLAAKSAVKSLKGDFSKKIHGFLDALTELRALTEATLDFPEEEIDFIEQYAVVGRLEKIQNQIKDILRAAKQGAILRDGIQIVLVGQPNVGKSSLLNALAGDEVAIVTPVAGTTRDRLKETIQINGIPLNIVDTAGLRDTSDAVEAIGIERTWQAIEQADVVLHLRDLTSLDDSHVADQALLQEIVGRLEKRVKQATSEDEWGPKDFFISAKTSEGIDHLKENLLKMAGWQPEAEGTIMARKRHIEALNEAQGHIQKALAELAQGAQFIDIAAEEMRLAQEALSTITGEFLPDDLLGKIFSTFCIGK
jgi:tRNA modification GTPase